MCELIYQKYKVANNLLPVHTHPHRAKFLFHISEYLATGERADIGLLFAFLLAFSLASFTLNFVCMLIIERSSCRMAMGASLFILED